MSRSDARRILPGAALIALLIAARALAANSDCSVVLDATEKLLTLPHHSFSYVTGTLPVDSEEPISSEMIALRGTTYVRQSDGRWEKGTSVSDLPRMYRENLKRAVHFDCRYVRDEFVDGELTSLYWTHEEAERASDESAVWISKRRGLIVRSESEIKEGAHTSLHVSIRHEFNDVQAPF